MRKQRFSEEQIINVLKEHQAGIPVVELCRKHGISDATFYTWRSKYGGMEVSDTRKLKALEDENRKQATHTRARENADLRHTRVPATYSGHGRLPAQASAQARHRSRRWQRDRL